MRVDQRGITGSRAARIATDHEVVFELREDAFPVARYVGDRRPAGGAGPEQGGGRDFAAHAVLPSRRTAVIPEGRLLEQAGADGGQDDLSAADLHPAGP